MRTARLRHVGAAPEDVDYKSRRGLDKALFQQLLMGKWIRDKRDLMITGPCGVGKTWLVCALARHEPRRDSRAAFFAERHRDLAGAGQPVPINPIRAQHQWLVPVDETRKRGFKKTVGFLSGTLAWLYSRSGPVWGSCSIALTGNQQIASLCTKNRPSPAILKHLNGKSITLNHVVDNF
jgi:hypothetical protein